MLAVTHRTPCQARWTGGRPEHWPDACTIAESAARSLHSLKADQEVGFRVPAPSAIRAMHDPHTTTSLDEILIYEDGELVFDGSDPSTYTVYETAADLAAALTAGPEPEDDR